MWHTGTGYIISASNNLITSFFIHHLAHGMTQSSLMLDNGFALFFKWYAVGAKGWTKTNSSGSLITPCKRKMKEQMQL
jgi:hypothetical protein